MKIDKTLVSGSAGMLVLQLLADEDMYGYMITEQLAERSKNVFEMKSGTLYPLLHSLEQKGYISAYEKQENGRTRRYYSITASGKKKLEDKKDEWKAFSTAVRRVMEGGI